MNYEFCRVIFRFPVFLLAKLYVKCYMNYNHLRVMHLCDQMFYQYFVSAPELFRISKGTNRTVHVHHALINDNWIKDVRDNITPAMLHEYVNFWCEVSTTVLDADAEDAVPGNSLRMPSTRPVQLTPCSA